MFKQISPNMLKTYQSCPKKFYYKYVEKLNMPLSSTPFEKGKKIHALANYYLRGVNISKIEQALTPEEKISWEKLLNNKYFQMNYFNSEYQLSYRLGSCWIGGRIDAIVCDNEKNYYILDYKTGAIPNNPKEDFQTIVYLVALGSYLNDEYNSISFVYVDLKNEKNVLIEYNNEQKLLYLKKLEEFCEKINKENLFAKNDKACSFCEYNKICQYK